MIKAWIVYGAFDAGKNKGSIEMFLEEFGKLDYEAELIIFDELKFKGYVNSAEYRGQKVDLPDIVVNRTRNYEFALWLNNNVKYSFNSPKLVLLGNDKVRAYDFVKKLGFKTLDIYERPEDILTWPVVAKTGSGHGGNEVFLVNSESEATELFGQYEGLFFQEYSPQGSRDMRVYVVGGEIYCAIKRSSETDFRSNYSLGGEVEETEVPQHIRDEISCIVNEIGEVGYCGIDFIGYEDKWIFGEIEDMVGARSVYSVTDYDPIAEFVKYIGKVCAEDAEQK